MANTLYTLTTELGSLMSALKTLLQGVDQTKALLNSLGWELPPGVDDLGLTGLDLAAFLTALDAVVNSTEAELDDELLMAERIAALASAVGALVDDLRRLADGLAAKLAGQGDYVSRTQIHIELPRRILDLLVINYLSAKSLLALSILNLLNLIEFKHFRADHDIFQVEHVRAIVHYDNLESLLSDPGRHMRESYGWDTPQFADRDLLGRVGQVFHAMGAAVRLQNLDRRAEEAMLGRPLLPTETEPAPQLLVTLYEQLGEDAGLKVGLNAFGLRPSAAGASDGGIGVLPIVQGQVAGAVPLNMFEDTFIEFAGGADLLKRIALLMRPGNLHLKPATSLGSVASGRFVWGVRHGTPDEAPKSLFSFPGGINLTLQQLSLMGGADNSTGDPGEIFVELGMYKCQLLLSTEGADEFLSSTLSSKTLSAPFDLGVSWSSRSGIHFKGSGGLAVTLPLYLAPGPMSLQSLYLSLDADTEGLTLEASVTGSLRLGPFAVTVDRVGMEMAVSFDGGNLGLFGLSPGLKPPSGLGLLLDAGVVKGGGYLAMDRARGEYAGAMELTLKGQSLKAIAILTTKMPSGAPGWSLLLLIYSQFPPMQLSWGFTLRGVGGMIGVQHGLQIEELKAGMRTGACDDILFPENPVADAPRILNRLRVIFPPTPRALVIGPMVELGWSTPTIIQIRMGLLFQFENILGGDHPAAIRRIILLGQLVAQLPPEVDDQAVVLVLRVDLYGYYEFDLNRLAFAAQLRDSHAMHLPLSGMLLLRAEFGAKPALILSAGGFHPRFKDLPADLPSPIVRLELKLDIGRLDVRAQMYFAVTAASIQTGAEIQVTAKIGPVSLSGSLGYDAILYLEPRFFFEVDLRAGVAIKYKGHNLASVQLEFHLEGPGRWRAKGKASFSILFWDVGVHFDEAWGDEPQIAPARTNVAQLMQRALDDLGNWRAQLPLGAESLVTLAITEGDGRVLAHPLGELQVSQKVAPLGLELQRFGSTRVDGPNRFEVTQLKVGGQLIAQPTAATEFFARAQFVDMSDEEKLSAPSFEPFASGITVGSSDYLAAPEVVAADLNYETAYLQPDDPVRPSTQAGKVSLGIGRAELLLQAQHGAAAKSRLRRTAALRPGDQRKVKVNEPPLAITDADTLTRAIGLDGLAQTASALAEQTARQALGNHALGSTHTLVEAFELVQ